MIKISNNKKIIISIIMIIIIIVLIIINIFSTKAEEIIIDTNEEIEKLEETENKIETQKIKIHITGAINNPGIIEVVEGSRIVDVIECAGGIKPEADLNKVNLAYIVKDAQKINIPSIYDIEAQEYITEENGDNVILEDPDEKKRNKNKYK